MVFVTKLLHQQKEYWYNSTFQIDLRFKAFSIKTNNALIFEPNNVCIYALKSNSEYFLHKRTSTITKSIIVGFLISQSFYGVHTFSPFFSFSRFLYFFHLYVKSHLEFGTRMYFNVNSKRRFFDIHWWKIPRSTFTNVIHYTMNCYLEFNLFSI